MELFDLLGAAARACESLGLTYYPGGAVASGYWGDPRPTRDVDVVDEMTPWKVRDFCALFPEPDYCVSVEAALEAVQRGMHFNIIHTAPMLKIDVMTPHVEGYAEQQFERARRVQLADGPSAVFAAPEDVILNKMLYYREGHSDKHLRDIASVLKVSRPDIDLAYINDWAIRLGLVDVWRQVQSGIGSQPPLPFTESPPP